MGRLRADFLADFLHKVKEQGWRNGLQTRRKIFRDICVAGSSFSVPPTPWPDNNVKKLERNLRTNQRSKNLNSVDKHTRGQILATIYVFLVKTNWRDNALKKFGSTYLSGPTFVGREAGCIFDTSFFLLKDHAQTVKDTRAVMKCPLINCKAVIACLPLINGDFRFKLVRPEDKISDSAAESQLNLCDQHRLHTYKIRMDVDVTKRKSHDLFDGYDDVIVIP
ncbi:hypothetical protein PoB_001084600 [Plakobranchus ocellatus]|uniref:Uncharacterized protein n=1 Tax=Plakobranchus ocellatus TaxID=259542 RepID=A0AAV3YPJ6_9GAST|nr:hypothetical protein PoB_001084600 [Plakobranchus ocellatus]